MPQDENPTEQFPRPTEVLPGLPKRSRPKRGLPTGFPVLPIVVTAASVVVAIVLVVVIVRLAAPGSPVAVASPSPVPTPTAVPAAPAPAPAEQAATPRPEPGENECVDALGDGAVMDLDTASLRRDGGDLVARFTLAAPIPQGETAVGLTLQSRGGQRVYQVGISWVDGRIDEYFVHDFAGDDQNDLDPRDVDVAGTQVTARFPDDMLKRLGTGWAWSAFATAAGSELDGCPDAPKVLTFDTSPGAGSGTGSNSGPGNSDRN